MTTPAKQTAIHYFPGNETFAKEVSKATGFKIHPIEVHRFPDGESLVRVTASPGRKAYVLNSLDHPNEKIFETLCAADALRREGATRVGLIAPYLGYLRQDKVFHSGEAVSQRVIAATLGQSFDEVLTLEAHLHRIKKLSEIFPCKALSISAAPAIASWVKKRKAKPVIVGPDEESGPWVRSIARLADLPFLVGEKTRKGDKRVSIEFPEGIQGKNALIVDDIASSGVTIAVAAKALALCGAKKIDVAVVHPIFAKGAIRRIEASGVNKLISGNSINHATNGISLAGLIAKQISPTRRSG
jgi:ribose-phosphate pyrophosphokinase